LSNYQRELASGKWGYVISIWFDEPLDGDIPWEPCAIVQDSRRAHVVLVEDFMADPRSLKEYTRCDTFEAAHREVARLRLWNISVSSGYDPLTHEWKVDKWKRKVPSSLIENFYRALRSGWFASSRARKAYNCLVHIGAASGFHSNLEHGVALRGINVVAIENTSEAATALVTYILLTKKDDMGTEGARCISRMTTPAAIAALDELVRKAWDTASRDKFVEYRQAYNKLLSRRQQPITHVVIDANPDFTKAFGYRIGIPDKSVSWEGVYWINIPNDGWIMPDGSCTLGINPELEAHTGELVFIGIQEAYTYAKQRAWTIINEP